MVSVIIPSYNREKTILRSIQSVLDQTYHDLELIVVDDCSTDRTREIVASVDDARVRYVCLEQNSGACVARNKGIALAKGDHIAFQDSDDAWLPDKLAIQLAALDEHGADVCSCQKQTYNENGEFYRYTQTNLPGGIVDFPTLYRSSRVSTQTILAKRSVFEECQFDPKVKKAQDYDWSLRAGEHFKFVFVAQPLVTQYFQTDSLTVKGRNHVVEIEMAEYFCEKYKGKQETAPDFYAALLIRLAYFKTLSNMNASKEYKLAYHLTHNKKYLCQCFLAKIGVLKYLVRKK